MAQSKAVKTVKDILIGVTKDTGFAFDNVEAYNLLIERVAAELTKRDAKNKKQRELLDVHASVVVDSPPAGPLMMPSAQLARIVGDVPLARIIAVTKVWQHIKENKLQVANNLRMIRADDKLRPIFGGKDVVSMFEMTKCLRDHLSRFDHGL